MEVTISSTEQALGEAAARRGAALLRRALQQNDEARIILATGTSQFEMLSHLVRAEGIDWPRVSAFHLDEYIGLPQGHPASFCRYLRERFVDELPQPIGEFHYLRPGMAPEAERERMSRKIADAAVDVAFIGIGENGHLAFNDPPADFETDEPYLIVRLDEACRRQQLGEGWFGSLSEVPKEAISMSVRQIMKAEALICSVPDQRKAHAVAGTLEGPVTPEVPASILQTHADCHLFLDVASASDLENRSTYSD